MNHLTPDEFPPSMNSLEAGYVMGLIVGEGSFSGDDQQASLSVKLHASDPLPLQVLQRFFGGKTYGPYFSQDRVFRTWTLRGPALIRSLPIFDAYLPDSKKREQYVVWKAKYQLGKESPQIELFLQQLEFDGEARELDIETGRISDL